MISCVGTITKDFITFNGKSEIKLGGAPYFFLITCKKFDIPCNIVSRIGKKEYKILCKTFDKKSLKFLDVKDSTTEVHIWEDNCDVKSNIKNYPKKLLISKDIMKSDIILFSTLFDEARPQDISQKILWKNLNIKNEKNISITNKLRNHETVIALDIQGYMRDSKRRMLSEFAKIRPNNINKLLSGVDILKCNDIESQKIFLKQTFSTKKTSKAVEERAKALSELGPKLVIITQGSKGIIAYDSTSNKFIRSLPKQQIKNHTVGAGDIFLSAFLCNLYETKNIYSSIKSSTDFTTRFLKHGSI